MCIKRDDAINIWGLLRDPEEEAKYFERERAVSSSLLSKVIIAFGVAFFLIVFLDYAYCERITDLGASITSRIVILGVSLICAFLLKVVKRQSLYYLIPTFFSGIVALSYVHILAEQGASALGYHGMGIMIILICLSLLRTPWAHLFIANIAVSAFFLICSYFFIDKAPVSNYIEVASYLAIVIFFTSVTQKQFSTEQRRKYLQEEKLKSISITDALTGCYNRLWFDGKLEEFSLFREYEQNSKFSIIMFDIDSFKKVNDTHGHMVGDRVLKECVDLVKSVLRPKDCFARWGGEEFIVLLPTTSLNEAASIAERMREAIESHEFNLSFALTCSFGVVARGPKENSDSLLQRGDAMLYRAKRNGKNRVEKDDSAGGGKTVFLCEGAS